MNQAETAEMQALPTAIRYKRRRGRKFLAGILIFLLVILLAATGLAWYGTTRLTKIPAAELTALSPYSGGPRNILIVGSDSRQNLPAEMEGKFGNFSGRRADVIMIFHVVPGSNVAQLISLPRDLKVDIPGEGTNRINAAYAFGGPDLLVRTVKKATGLPIHNYSEIGFGGFARIIDAVGGVEMNFKYAARDSKSGLAVDKGNQTLDGMTALAMARSRHYQEKRGSGWVNVKADDLGRASRQQRLIASLVSEVKEPMTLLELPEIYGALDGIAVDESFNFPLMSITSIRMLVIGSGGLERAVLPVDFSNEGGRSYVVPEKPAAGRMLERFGAGESIES